MPELPNTPTCREEGYDLVHGPARFAVPLETPAPIVAKLTEVSKRVTIPRRFGKPLKKHAGITVSGFREFRDFLIRESQVCRPLYGSNLTVRSA
jgi:tripartite-type tricarboxylate transporter receptor subunit TctC